MPTLLSDIQFDPAVYATYQDEKSVVPNAFAASGVVIQNGVLNQRAKGPSEVTSLPTWSPLDTSSEPNFSTDDPADKATPGKITSKLQLARNAYLNNGWSSGDLLAEINDGDPMKAIARRTSEYWSTQFQKRLIAACKGVLADNITNDGEDMVVDVSSDAAEAITDAERVSGEVVIDALQTLGDQKSLITALAVHSQIQARLQKQGLIEYIRDADNNIMFATFMGLRLIVDDGLPAVAGTNRVTYTSILFGRGAFGLGEGKPKLPVEIQRSADGGMGGGIETLWERKTWLLHPLGFSFVADSLNDQSASLAELSAGASWNRIFERKAIPMAFLRTND